MGRPRMIICMMLFCWVPSGLDTGECLQSDRFLVQGSDFTFVAGVGLKVFDDQASEAYGDMQGAKDCCRSLPDFVRPAVCLFI